MTPTNEAGLGSRVARLERTSDRLLRFLLLTAAGVGGVFALGQAPRKPVEKLVEAERFVLRMPNDPGPRAILGTNDQGAVSLAFLRPNGKTAVGLGYRADGQPAVELFDQAIKRASLDLDNMGRPRMELWDGKGILRVVATVREAGGGLQVLDAEGRTRAVIGLDGESGRLIIWDDKNSKVFEKP